MTDNSTFRWGEEKIYVKVSLKKIKYHSWKAVKLPLILCSSIINVHKN